MPRTMGSRKHAIYFTDGCIVKAYEEVREHVKHVDAPTETELVRIRARLPVETPELISLHWLKSQLVSLGKANKLPKQEG